MKPQLTVALKNIPTIAASGARFVFGGGDTTVITREYPTEWTVGAEPYYPVNDDKNQALYERYRLLAQAEEKVHFGGRLGQYRYFDMDKVVYAAMALAKEIL